ncbi:MAG: hypothetical protein GY765_24705, partial [bacterium]|nr:hypothetical protein [bacterium]
HPGVKEAVVTAPKYRGGERYLCAYVVPGAAGTDITGPALKEDLAAQLPAYMVPAYFVELEKFPLNANGKIDRKALPPPGLTSDDHMHRPPGSEIERKLAAVWQRVLDIDKDSIGIYSNFFDLGGNSIKATILASQVHKDLEVKLPLVEIFKTPHIKGLAEYIANAAIERCVSIRPAERKEYYQLSYNQERLWLAVQLKPNSPAYNMPGRISLDHNVDPLNIRRTLAKIMERHESFRTGFTKVNHQPVQFVLPEVDVPMEVYDISTLDKTEKDQKLEELAAGVTGIAIPLAEAPLFRSALIKLEEEKYQLVFNMHHIISDGWSIRILSQEFSHIYEGARQGLETVPPGLKLHYKDFAQWQADQLRDPAVKEGSHQYWRKIIERGLHEAELPRDFKGNADTDTTACASYRFVIPGETKDLVQELAADADTSLFIVLFAVLNVWLARLCGKENVMTGILGAGRQQVLLHDIVGFFVNTMVMQTHVDFSQPFSHFLRSTNSDLLEMMEHQGYPLELVLEDLKTTFPHISLLFNMFNMDSAAAEKNIDNPEPFHTEKVQDTKFDMVVYAYLFKNGIEIQCHYRTDFFKPSTIEFMMGQYGRFMESIARNPAKELKEIVFSKRKKKLKLLKKPAMPIGTRGEIQGENQ